MTPAAEAKFTRAVTETVMGWQVLDDEEWHRIGAPEGVLVYEPFQDAFFFADKPKRATRPWNPIHSPADALELLEMLRHSGEWCCLDICSDFHYVWDVRFTPFDPSENAKHDPTVSVTDEELPRAICYAVAKAVGIEVPGDGPEKGEDDGT